MKWGLKIVMNRYRNNSAPTFKKGRDIEIKLSHNIKWTQIEENIRVMINISNIAYARI